MNSGSQELENVEFHTYWNPLLYVENLIRQEKETREFSGKIDPNTECCTVIERRKIRGLFMQSLQLNYFPFDVQVSIFAFEHKM